MAVTGRREQIGHLAASRCDGYPLILHNLIMKTYEILSKTREGKLIAVVSVEARNAQMARQQTANFCDMMNIEVHSVRRNTRREKK